MTQIEVLINRLDAAAQYFPAIIVLDDLTSHKQQYADDELVQAFMSLALSDIHARLVHFKQFFKPDMSFNNRQKEDIVKYAQQLRENVEQYSQQFEKIVNKVLMDVGGQTQSAKTVLDEIYDDIINNCDKIIKYYSKKLLDK